MPRTVVKPAALQAEETLTARARVCALRASRLPKGSNGRRKLALRASWLVYCVERIQKDKKLRKRVEKHPDATAGWRRCAAMVTGLVRDMDSEQALKIGKEKAA